MRADVKAAVVMVGVVIAGTPGLGHSQSPTVTRGLLRAPSTPATTDAVQRAAPTGVVARGALQGPVPPGGSVGLLGSGAPPSVGTVSGFRGVVVLPPGEGAGLLRGDLPAGTPVGALPAPSPPGTRLGELSPSEIARRNESEARINLMKGDAPGAESMLRQAVSIREEVSGPDSPEVLQALGENAALLRAWNRESAAAAMDAQAAEIRGRLEKSAHPTPAPPALP